MISRQRRHPALIAMWALGTLFTLFFAVGLLVAATTFWVAYHNPTLPGSWLPLTAPVLIIPLLVAAWIRALRACIRRANRSDIL